MIGEPARKLDEGALRALVPRVLAGLVRRGEDFDAAEDALQEALVEALRVWPSTRRATRARGWRRSRPGGWSTPAAARPPVSAVRRRRTRSRGAVPPRRATTPFSS